MHSVLRIGKKFVVTFLILNTLYFILYTKVSAHVLETDGTVGAVLHIDPEDDPIVGQPAAFFFEFKDKLGKFDPKNCICTVSILKSGKQVFSQDLFSGNENPSLTNASIFYTFPEHNVYTIKVDGISKNNSFDSFSLTYNLRVSRTSDASQQVLSQIPPNLIWYILGGIGVLLIGLLLAAKVRQTRR